MTEDDARNVVLIRAVETEDAAAALLTREDRQQATAAGLAGRATSRRNSGADETFLARRAAFALARLASRVPSVDRVRRVSHWPRWLGWAVPAAAFALGIATNEISGSKRLNLIAFPLVGMLAWNMAAYLILAAHWLRNLAHRRADRGELGRLSRAVGWLTGLSRLRGDAHQPIGRALARFAADWAHHSARLTEARARRTLHLGAATFAIGVVAGMYLRALGVEYRAGWESTFLGAGGVHRVLTLALTPASAVTGIALPDVAHLMQLRWSEGPGENAGPWIHLYAATAFLFIVAPRLLLTAVSALAAARLRRRLPVPGREDFHTRRLLRAAYGGAAQVRVVPYGFRPTEPDRRALGRLLTDALGDGTHVTFETPMAYGAEEEWLARDGVGDVVDHLLVLFSLASTPELENHGALVRGIRQALVTRRSGTALTVLVDDSAYRERLAGQPGSERRTDERRAAWERMLAEVGAQPFFLNPTPGDSSVVARRLEAALVQTPTLLPTGEHRR